LLGNLETPNKKIMQDYVETAYLKYRTVK